MQHTHEERDTRIYMPVYLRAWGLTFVIAGLELVGSIISGSFALLADITHVFTDTIIGLAPVSVEFFRHRINISPQRIERVGGILVALMLVLVGYHVLGEAIGRMSGGEEHDHEVSGLLMFIFSGLAAITNFAQHRLLSRISPMHRHAAHAGFHFHVMTDLVKNIILPLIAIAIMFGATEMLDIWASIAIGSLIILRAVILLFESSVGRVAVEEAIRRILNWVAR